MPENQDFVRTMPMNRDLSKSSTREGQQQKLIAGGKSDQESPMSRYNLP